jgi:hypothetical protein
MNFSDSFESHCKMSFNRDFRAQACKVCLRPINRIWACMLISSSWFDYNLCPIATRQSCGGNDKIWLFSKSLNGFWLLTWLGSSHNTTCFCESNGCWYGVSMRFWSNLLLRSWLASAAGWSYNQVADVATGKAIHLNAKGEFDRRKF